MTDTLGEAAWTARDLTAPTIDVDEDTVKLGVALGLMRRATDGAYELTTKGEEWLRAYLAARLPLTNRDPGDETC